VSDLHAARLRLIEELRRVLAETIGERADILGRPPPLAGETLDLRQSVAREGA